MGFTTEEENVLKAVAKKESISKQIDEINTAANTARAAKQSEIEVIESQRATDLSTLSAQMATAEAVIVASKDVIAPK